jgi:hypothetical protein
MSTTFYIWRIIQQRIRAVGADGNSKKFLLNK